MKSGKNLSKSEKTKKAKLIVIYWLNMQNVKKKKV